MAPSEYSHVKIGVLTSGGDAQGMNAAVRAVVRTALAHGAQPYAIMEGWAGAVQGGNAIREMNWSDVSNILPAGGTIIGTARCAEFREYEGRHTAARNLLEKGIDRLVVIGGDGSLTGTNEFRSEWNQHVVELLDEGVISAEQAQRHQHLSVIGLVGSIDNDMVGTDMTIGADTALHRIIDAIDQITSTAASHQRTFILEVMGRYCGYLPLMAAIAGGADYVFTPENPPADGWEQDMCDKLLAGRQAGRRESIILLAEGAADRHGIDLTAQRVAEALKERTGEDARITILGHVQRGGSPSAYDRWMSALLGYAAVQEILTRPADKAPEVLGVRRNRITRIPLMEAVHATRAVKKYVEAGDYQSAINSRGSSFVAMMGINDILSAPPGQGHEFSPGTVKPGARVAVLHVGGLAPGMNSAARAAVRLGIARGWKMLGVEGSWAGLADNAVRELVWSDVEGWAFQGGAELGTRRPVPTIEQFYALGRAIEKNDIDALIIIGGLNAYLSVHAMMAEKDRYPAFKIPMMLVPASIDNNLPGSELSIGADTAVNNAMWALDRIKESAAASRRCFVAEIMGRRCGYLTFMAGLSSGAEFAYLNEEPLTLRALDDDAQRLRASFEHGRRLFLAVLNEGASAYFDREFLARTFESEGEGLYDVRHQALGHLQQGGAPTPFDRLLATRLVHFALGELEAQFVASEAVALYVGQIGGGIEARPVERMFDDLDISNRRPYQQWWTELRPVLETVSLRDGVKVLQQIPVDDADGVRH